jgi:ribosomal protein L11 methyltransferase
MSRKNLWGLSIATLTEAEDAVVEVLNTLFPQAVASHKNVETGEVLVTAYLQSRPGPFRAALLDRLMWIKRCGINTGPCKIRLLKIRKENWANSWKRHFHPIEIGSALLVKPSWSRRRCRKAQAQVILDPGLSFGTGQHPTTTFCLEQLADFRNPENKGSFLDIGTGSGILAIAAAKLGYSPVEAFDIDAEAVRVARANARRNRILKRIHLYHADLTKLPRGHCRKYDLICANLISNLLVSEQRRIVARMKPGGVLILAGILRGEFNQVQRAFEQLGLRLIASRADKEWRSGAFAFQIQGKSNIRMARLALPHTSRTEV